MTRRFAAGIVALAVALLPLAAHAVPQYRAVYMKPKTVDFSRQRVQSVVLPDGTRVVTNGNGTADVFKGKSRSTIGLAPQEMPNRTLGANAYAQQLRSLTFSVRKPLQRSPYAPGVVLVVFRNGVTISSDHFALPAGPNRMLASALTSPLTSDLTTNRVLSEIGVRASDRLFASVPRSTLSSMRYAAQSKTGRPVLDISNAFRLQVTLTSVEQAVQLLKNDPNVAYASPDFFVSPMHSPIVPVPDAVKTEAQSVNRSSLRRFVRSTRSRLGVTVSSTSGLPNNFGLATSEQALLNSSSLDVAAAYDEIERQYNQLPGTGEIVTNVSLGDVVAAEDNVGTTTSTNECPTIVKEFGPTTQMIGGQRYINWPGMPLIPAYAADINGHIDPAYTACGVDPTLGEVGLDFSMMAPLPENQQRAGETGQGFTDLLGIAPGASYRLVVPTTTQQVSNTLSAIYGALVAAANQVPRPNVITASLGQGNDVYGFPSRYLEDDPLAESLISAIVNSDGIVMCVAAGDGTRPYTDAPIGPSGGSAPTNLAADQTAITNLLRLTWSTAPSYDLDSGAIDVGGVTLDDIFSAPPQDPTYASLAYQHAFPENRYDGGQDISSGFGSRVNISAPADNVIALSQAGPTFDSVNVGIVSGTSASSPEVAAAAAVVLQVARLTGHPFSNPVDLRSFLVAQGTPVTQTAQTDVPLNVGPELDLRRAVETLMAQGGIRLHPSVARVAVEQRRPVAPLDTLDSTFVTDTNPLYIDLQGVDYGDGNGPDGSTRRAWITIAPDWEAIPSSARYSLFVTGKPAKVLATTPTARLLPETILAAIGQPLVSTNERTVNLTYRATVGLHEVAQATFAVTFGPADSTSVTAQAPIVPLVVTGSSFPVTYDISSVRNFVNPQLVVTEPGRLSPSAGFLMHFPYFVPLTSAKGTITVPVSALQGGGLYGVGILGTNTATGNVVPVDFATVRIASNAVQRPAAPLLALNTTDPPSNFVEMPYGGTVQISWNANGIPGGNGATLEVSAPGPGATSFNMFNNPNGSIPDGNGVDSGSIKLIPLPAASGTMTMKASDLGIHSTMLHQLRVLATNGSSVVGEAGDVSTIILDGQVNSIAGGMDTFASGNGGGFLLNPNGTDGIATGTLPLAGAAFETTVDVFDQNAHTATSMANAIQSGGPVILGGGMYANDTAIYGERGDPNDDLGTTYFLSKPVSRGHAGLTSLALPSSSYDIFQLSYEPSSPTATMLFYDQSKPYNSVPLQVMTMNLVTKTFNAAVNSPVPLDFLNEVTLFNTDSTLNKALFVNLNTMSFTGPTTVSQMDLTTGAVQQIASIAQGTANALAVDTTTHLAMYPSIGDNSLVIYNVQTQAEKKIALPIANPLPTSTYGTYNAEFIAADPVNHLFIAYAPNGANLGTDLNATPVIYVYDEQGNLLKTITGYSASQGFFVNNAANYLQVNGTTRTAYLLNGNQLAIFNY